MTDETTEAAPTPGAVLTPDDVLTPGAVLRAIRERRGISARQLSIQCGWHGSTVGRYEVDARTPTLPDAATVLGALDASDAEIVEVVRAAGGGR